GARHAVRDRVTVRVALTSKVVTLDGAGKTLTDGGTGYVDLLACFEHAFNGHHSASRKFGGLGGIAAEFRGDDAGFNAGFGLMPSLRLGDARGAARAVCYLYRCIPIDFW